MNADKRGSRQAEFLSTDANLMQGKMKASKPKTMFCLHLVFHQVSIGGSSSALRT
jgi:hypothetical protein